MKHLLIAIGCDVYDHASPLSGAENDARNIFRLLTDGAHGFCRQPQSTLILSPTLAQLQSSLLSATKLADAGDVVTVYFAGHGYVKADIFYLCCRDTQIDRVGVTAFPLSNLLSLIHDIAPSHANVIVDACHSGSVMGDFKRALSPDTIGGASTVGISLLAACATDQLAGESNGEGLCTSVIGKCIDGSMFVQDLDPVLDLASISAVVARTFQGSRQQPTFWGLNLTGQPNFCVNPHFCGDGELRRALAEAKPINIPPRVADALQSLYRSLDRDFSPAELQRLLADAIGDEVEIHTRLRLVNSLLGALQNRAAAASDPFRAVEVGMTCLSHLLPYCSKDAVIDDYVRLRCRDIAATISNAIEAVVQDVADDEFSLLGNSGFGELFVLPVRITKLVGWLGWAIWVAKLSNTDCTSAIGLAHRVLTLVLTTYHGSIRAMSDAQAAPLLVAASALRCTELQERVEELAGIYFLDHCEANGLLARVDLGPDKIIDFLIAKSRKEEIVPELQANPSALVAVLLLIGAKLDLCDAFDLGLIDLDRRNANVFMPESYSDFGVERIVRGYNATMQIGDGIWRVEDFAEKWKSLQQTVPESTAVALLSAACSLVFPDRVAWHLMES